MIPSLQILDGADINGEEVDDSLDGEVSSPVLPSERRTIPVSNH